MMHSKNQRESWNLYMNDKIYILKEKVELRVILFMAFLLTAWIIYAELRYRYITISTNERILTSVIFLLFYYIFIYFRIRGKNKIAKTGKLIWCKVDRSRCQNNVAGIVIRGGYFWEETKTFIEYTGGVRTFLQPRRDEYAQILEKVKYMPVFVDLTDRNKYVMVSCDLWARPEEIDKRSKDIIRVIDNRLYKKEQVDD